MDRFRENPKFWEPPIELQRSTPRDVQLSRAGRAVVLLMIVLVAAATAGSLLLASRASEDEHRWAAWQKEAVAASGEVTQIRKRGRGSDSKYYVDYGYRAVDRDFSGTAMVRSREGRALKQGDTVSVFFRRSEPSQSWLSGHEPRGVPWWSALLIGMALLAPIPILAFVIRRQRRLLEEGRPALATVTALKKVSSQHGAHYTVRYEFVTTSGSRRAGKYTAQRRSPIVGDSLIVVYHPDEEWSSRYPLSMVKVRDSG
jgi:hypothetical protein